MKTTSNVSIETKQRPHDVEFIDVKPGSFFYFSDSDCDQSLQKKVHLRGGSTSAGCRVRVAENNEGLVIPTNDHCRVVVVDVEIYVV